MLNSLAYKNCVRRPTRTIILVMMSLALSFSLLTGVMVNLGLSNGLNSLETRLGADIMVIPESAAAKQDFNNIILQGSTGYFYMDKTVEDKLINIDGVKEITSQLYLASLGSSCCSSKLQLIGFDEDTDFVIKPWLGDSNQKNLGDMQILVGSQINAFPGEKLMFYGVNVEVAGRLDETGTYVDAAVYADNKTIRELIGTAEENKAFQFKDIKADEVVSSVLINIESGYQEDEIINNINSQIDGVVAIRTQSMIADVADKLIGIAGLTKLMIGIIWILIMIIMFMSFSMITNERKKEFAILRNVGATKKKIFFVIFNENIIISIIGSFAGALLSIAVSSMSANNIEETLGFPFLLPNMLEVSLIAVIVIIATVATASVSAGFRALKIIKTDAALLLRGEN